MKKSAWRIVAVGAICVSCFSFVLLMFVVFLTDKDATERDFIEYWATGQLLVQHANPYDPVAILKLQSAKGMEDKVPKITFSPPPLLIITLPLGFVGPKTGLISWLFGLVGTLMASLWFLWALFGRPESGLQYCGFVFAPVAACLMAGQLGIFLLFGIVLFLYFEARRPYLAGAALLPCAWKPHLFLPFFVVLLLWSITRQYYRAIIGLSGSLALSCVLITHLDSKVWLQYSNMMSRTGVLQAFVPTLSVTLRFLINRNAEWLQFVPEVAACIWAAWYFWARRSEWNWLDQGLLVLLVGFLCAPYAWFSDEAVLLAPVLAGVFRASEKGQSLLPIALIAGIALAEVTILGRMASPYYLWTVPAWLGWYLFATWDNGDRTPATT